MKVMIKNYQKEDIKDDKLENVVLDDIFTVEKESVDKIGAKDVASNCFEQINDVNYNKFKILDFI